jgi:hypothetical protein
MKKILGFILLLVAPLLSAQTTAVSATVTDTDGVVWANGSWKITFVPNPSQPNPSIYNINGTPLSTSVMYQSGTINNSGALSFSVYQNSPITPTGSTWTVIVCPNAITACGIYNFTAAGSTMSLSSALTANIPVPRFKAVAGAYGYTDGEAVLQLGPGGNYWNVTSGCQRYYNAVTTSWSCPSGGGGGGASVSPPAYSVQVADATATNLASDPNITEDLARHKLLVGGPITTNSVSVITNPPLPASWVWDWTSPLSALTSLGDIPVSQILGPYGTGCLQWDGGNRITQNPCGSGTVTSVGVTVPAQMGISGAPLTGSGTLAFTLNTTGTANKVVTGTGTYTLNHLLKINAAGDAIDSGVAAPSSTVTDYYWTVTATCSVGGGNLQGCISGGSGILQTTLPGNMPDASYQIGVTADSFSYTGSASPSWACAMGTNNSTSGSYTLPTTTGSVLYYHCVSLLSNGGTGGQPAVYFHAHHN